jgi:choline dehydrogenase-like flavoprotein
MSGQILTHTDLTAPFERSCDVAIIGSGAGGAVLAAGLAEAGLSVIMLEEGSHLTRTDFTLQERDAYPALYQESTTRSTADQAISILQGRSVGGSTTINWTTCFRTPERILDHWQRVHGIEGLDGDSLAPHFDAVEARLSIQTWPGPMANPNNAVLRDGCAALGWEASPLRRNVRGCANSGYCGMGCPVDGKQAMGITYIQDAVDAGMTLLANVRADRIEESGGRVVAIHGRVISPGASQPDGSAVVIRPRVTVSSAGAINGPMLLLRSGIDSQGLVGRRTFLHPVIGMLGMFAHQINPYYGAPQSWGSHHLYDRGPDRVGMFFEAAPMHPSLAATALNLFGDDLRRGMQQLPHSNVLLSLAVDGLHPDDDGGVVSLRSDGRLRLDYPVRPFLVEAMRVGHRALAEIQLAAGASFSRSLHNNPVELRSRADLDALDAAPYGAHEHPIFTAHQMGGCAMGSDPSTSVVDAEHRHHRIPNLFVVDGSVLPTALGVNPSETIYGLAHRARQFVGEAV